MIRAVLFDLDDTLFDHRHSSRCAITTLHQQHTCLQRDSIDQVESAHLELLELLHEEMLRGQRTQLSARRERFRRLFEAYGQLLNDDESETVAHGYREAFQATRQTVRGAQELLQALRRQGMAIGIITNNMRDEQRAKLAHLGLTHLVDELITSEEIGTPKPDPAIFLAALERFACMPTEAVMVGDSWRADIAGATAVGMRAVWLNRHAQPCPDPNAAIMITGFEPVDAIAQLILAGGPSGNVTAASSDS